MLLNIAEPWIKNDAVILGILVVILALIFKTSSAKSGFFHHFYKWFPALLLCYFIPAILNSLNIINGEQSNLYFVASRYLLPASLILLCISIDLKGVLKLGSKALIMFLTATFGIIIGGPIALYIIGVISPEVISTAEEGSEIWRGLSTVAGSWIGGGANQTAMKEIYGVSDKLFSAMLIVDVVVANIWMGIILFGTGFNKKLNNWLKADNSAIAELQTKMENYHAEQARVSSFNDIAKIMAVAFGGVALSHFGADFLGPLFKDFIDAKLQANPDSLWIYLTAFGKNFFWIVVIATLVGISFSFTRVKHYEGAGASKFGSIFLYVLVATIGMHINIAELVNNWIVFKYLIAIGIIWMIIHILLLLVVAKIIKAPFFFVAVGSQANVGGAASAPVVASAFSPALAPVGVLLAVFGYAVGTVGAIICTTLLIYIS